MSTRGINKVTIQGFLGKDPELRTTTKGVKVVNVNLATSEQWKDKESGEPQSKTDWHRVTFFGKKAETISEYFKKGDPITVFGSNRSLKRDMPDGTVKYEYYVEGNDFGFVIGNRNGSSNSSSEEKRQAQPPVPEDDFDDEIPF